MQQHRWMVLALPTQLQSLQTSVQPLRQERRAVCGLRALRRAHDESVSVVRPLRDTGVFDSGQDRARARWRS